MEKKNKKINLYDWLGVLKQTKQRFLKTMRGNETQDSFLNKLLDLYYKEEKKEKENERQN